MKRIPLFLLVLILNRPVAFAQAGSVLAPPSWSAIDSLMLRDMRPQSALKALQTRWAWVKRKNDPAEDLRCQLYAWALQEWQSDFSQDEVIRGLQSKTKTEKNPLYLSLVQMMLARQLSDFFEQHRWNIQSQLQKTTGSKGPRKDWTTQDYHDSIGGAIAQAEKQAALLQATPLSAIPYFWQKGTHSLPHTTALDLLLKIKLAYWEQNWTGVRQWQSDTLKQQLVYTQWENTHAKDADPSLLVWIKTAALAAEKNRGLSPEKWRLAMAALINTYPHATTLGKVYHALASQEMAAALSAVRPHTPQSQAAYPKALQWISQAQQNLSPPVFEQSGLVELRDKILAPSLSVTVEGRQEPEKPFRVLVRYRNLSALWYQVVPSGPDNLGQKELWKSSAWPQWPTSTNAPLRLPPTNDYLEHAVEVKMDALSFGAYTLWVKGQSATAEKVAPQAAASFQVSRLGYLRDQQHLFLRDVFNGKELAHTPWQLYERERADLAQPKQVKPPVAQGVSDEKGHVELPAHLDKNFSLQLHLTKGKDHWEEPFYWSRPYATTDEQTAVDTSFFLYADRQIYRQGQVVFLTSIGLVQPANGKTQVLSHGTVPLQIFNSNNQLVDSLLVAIHPWGGVAAQWKIPEDNKGGYFRFQVKDKPGQGLTVRVEAYKRPEFLVQWETAPFSQHLNDSLRVRGWVLGYAGNKIADAHWEYQVRAMGWQQNTISPKMRAPNEFPIWTGKGKTRADGLLDFVLPPVDLPANTDRRSFQVFYGIQVKITLPNGSTLEKNLTRQAEEKQYRVLVKDAQSMGDWGGEHLLGALPTARVEIRNGDNKKIDTTIRFSLYRQTVPKTFFRKPLWQDQDLFLYTPAEYRAWFPLDPYKAEDLNPGWDSVVHQTPVSLGPNNGLSLAAYVQAPGRYKWVLSTTDPMGLVSEASGYLHIIDPQDPNAGFLPQLKAVAQRNTRQPNPVLAYGFPVSSIPVLVKTTTALQKNYSAATTGKNQILFSDTVPFNRPLTYHLACWYGGRFYATQYTLFPPAATAWQLMARWEKPFFQPKENAKWQLAVKDKMGKALPAWVWGTVYDARLETLVAHQWQLLTDRFGQPYSSRIEGGAWGGGESISMPLPTKKYTEKEWGVPDLLYDGRQYWNPVVKGIVDFQKNGGPLNEMVTTAALAGRPGAADGIQIRGSSRLAKQEEDDAKVFTSVEQNDPLTGEKMVNGRPVGTAMDANAFVRKDFRETAFFLPVTATDSTGSLDINVVFPDALTQWKWMAMAATPDGQSQLLTGTVQTQKKFLLQTNWPRFLREGDHWELQVLLSNGDSSERTGTAVFELIDPKSQRPVDGWFQNSFPQQYFTVAAKGQSLLRFPLQIPFGYNRNLLLRTTATAGELGDAMEMTLPVLSRRELLRDAIPLVHAVNTRQSWVFPGWEKSLSPSLSHEKFTVQVSAHPLQDFLAQLDSLVPAAPTGPLDWVNVLRREGMRKVGSKANPTKVKEALLALQSQQKSNGLFPWYANGPGDAWITEYLLRALGPWRHQWSPTENALLDSIGKKAYGGWQKNAYPGVGKNLSQGYLQKLWGIPLTATNRKNWQAARQQWQKLSLLEQVDLALSAPSAEAGNWTSKTLLPSFKERAIIDSNGGWHWKADERIAPSMLSVFAHEPAVVKGILTQLLGQAQTLETTHDPYSFDVLSALFSQAPALAATSAAVPNVELRLGNALFNNNTKGSTEKSATTLASVSGEKITHETGKIILQSQSLSGQAPPLSPLYGSAQWWYREDIAALPPAGKALQLRKKYFRAIAQDGQTQWEEIVDPTVLPLGEKLRIELSIWSQQALSHVVCQDDRFSGAEPVEQLSAHTWDAGTAAYRYLTDSTMVFSLPHLRKGWTRLSYEVYMTQTGIFHSGISRVYSAFSPAFTARDAGRVLRIKPAEE